MGSRLIQCFVERILSRKHRSRRLVHRGLPRRSKRTQALNSGNNQRRQTRVLQRPNHCAISNALKSRDEFYAAGIRARCRYQGDVVLILFFYFRLEIPIRLDFMPNLGDVSRGLQ